VDSSSDDDEDPAAPSYTKASTVRLAPDQKHLDASTNIPTARGASPVAPHATKPRSRNGHVSYKTTAQEYKTRDSRTVMEKQRNGLPEVKPEALHSPSPATLEATEHGAMAEGLDQDDARTHKMLTQMFAESRNIEAADSSHLPHPSINHDLVHLLEDDERILGYIKEMKEAEYPQLLDIAAIILGFEQCKKRLEHGSSEEAVLEEIAGDASPTL